MAVSVSCDEHGFRAIDRAYSEVIDCSTFIFVGAEDTEVIIIIVRWVSVCQSIKVEWCSGFHSDIIFMVWKNTSCPVQLATKNRECFGVLNFEKAGPVSKMLPIINFVGRFIQGIILRQQLVS